MKTTISENTMDKTTLYLLEYDRAGLSYEAAQWLDNSNWWRGTNDDRENRRDLYDVPADMANEFEEILNDEENLLEYREVDAVNMRDDYNGDEPTTEDVFEWGDTRVWFQGNIF